MTPITDFLGQLQTTTTLEEIQDLVTSLRDDYGVENAIYHVVGNTGREYGALTYDPDWVSYYIENDYLRIDPVVSQTLRSFGPVDWSKLDWTPPKARQLMGEAIAAGVGKSGLSIPIRGVNGQFAMFTVTSQDDEDNWIRFLDERTSDLILAGYYLHQKAAEIVGAEIPLDGPTLSPRERDVLSHLAIGRSRSETAERLQISEHTLRVYVDAARHKLGAANTTHAVALAMTRGEIIT